LNHAENDTNVANVDDKAGIIQDKEPVGVAANSGVNPGPDSENYVFPVTYRRRLVVTNKNSQKCQKFRLDKMF
jgi:hypothetical protein